LSAVREANVLGATRASSGRKCRPNVFRHADRAGDPTCPPLRVKDLLCAMDGGDHPDKEVEANTIAFLKAGREYFCSDARDPHLAVRFVGELVVHVVRQLAVNADWLHSMKHRVATAF
jgi:hypothetical protein